MKSLLTQSLNQLGLAWWVEITTTVPQCTYYFGPFGRYESALNSQAGYIEDLEKEGAQQIQVQIKRCKPEVLTICDEPEMQPAQLG
jgi:hypothetical protein